MASSELHDVVWTKTKPPDTLSRSRLDGVNIAMLTLASFIFATRTVLRIVGKKAAEAQDILSYMAYVCYVLMVVMYLQENDPLYRAESVLRGERPAYQGILHDAGMVYRWMTAGQLFFYASLTLVKLSLLAFYQHLVSKAGPRYVIIWWAVLGFCVLSFIGSSLTTILLCDDQRAKYNQGMCAKPHEQRRAQFSLWFAYAVDVATDLAVMFLPFRITWNLRLPGIQKAGIFVLFGSGWICILFATLRVVQVSTNNGIPKIPDPKWLQMWTIIETSMAVIIGCGPAFNALFPRYRAQNARRRPINLEYIKEPDLATRSNGETSQI